MADSTASELPNKIAVCRESVAKGIPGKNRTLSRQIGTCHVPN